MKIISWNVNGINSAAEKGAIRALQKEEADVYCFQEVKAAKDRMPQVLDGYRQFHGYAQRRGYSGVSVFSRTSPISVVNGIGIDKFDSEGRVLALEYQDFFLVNAYFPNSTRELTRLEFKLEFDECFMKFCKSLEKKKPIVVTGDFNVAHTEKDIARPKENEGNAGFTKPERDWFADFLDSGFIDTFREFNEDGGHYTWWSYMFNSRSKDIGWRIDYFIVSRSLKSRLVSSRILKSVMGSDHCPIVLELS